MSVSFDSTRSTQRATSADATRNDKPGGSASGSDSFASKASGLMVGGKMDPQQVFDEKPRVWVSTGAGSSS